MCGFFQKISIGYILLWGTVIQILMWVGAAVFLHTNAIKLCFLIFARWHLCRGLFNS